MEESIALYQLMQLAVLQTTVDHHHKVICLDCPFRHNGWNSGLTLEKKLFLIAGEQYHSSALHAKGY